MCLTIPKKVIEVGQGTAVVESHNGRRQSVRTMVALSVGDFVFTTQNMVYEKIEKEYADEIFDILKGENQHEHDA